MSSNKVSGTDQAPTLSYMLFVHRLKLRTRAKLFTKELSLTQSKLYITDTLISETKKQQYQHRDLNLDNSGILNREQLFCNYLKNKINKMLAWKKMSPEERMQTMQTAIATRKAMKSQGNEEENCAKRQKLDDGSVIKTEKVQHSKSDDHSC